MTAFAEAETIVRGFAQELTSVRRGECVYCYASRMLDAFGCNERLRWAVRFRDLTAPRATGLEERLATMGGFCDCEIFLNGVVWAPIPTGGCEDYSRDEEFPPCSGVRRGSTQGCVRWIRRSHWLPC
jgi:Protein of unknown function (DUF2695)